MFQNKRYLLSVAFLMAGSVPATSVLAGEAPTCSDPQALQLVAEIESKSEDANLMGVQFGLTVSDATTERATPANNGWYCEATGKWQFPTDPEKLKVLDGMFKMGLADRNALNDPITVYYKIQENDAGTSFRVSSSMKDMPD